MAKLDILALEALFGRKLTPQEVIDLITWVGDDVSNILKPQQPHHILKYPIHTFSQDYFEPKKGRKGFIEDYYDGNDKSRKPVSIFGDVSPKMKPPIENILYKNNYKIIDYISDEKKSFLKENIKNIYNILDIQLNNSINKNVVQSVSTSVSGFTAKMQPDTMIGARNIADAVFPLVEYIHATQPDCIIACDRGARLIGLAVFKLYQELYGPLPTYNGTVQFRRISKSNPQSQTQAHLAHLADELLRSRPNPTILVLDDWVVSGATKDIVKESFENLAKGRGKIDVKFGVLQGGNADVSGNDSKTNGFAGTVDWHDDAVKIGVNYAGMTPKVVSTDTHRAYRTEMMSSIEVFAAKKKRERGEKTNQEKRKKQKKVERSLKIPSPVISKDLPLGSDPIILEHPEGKMPETITSQDDIFTGEPVILEEPRPLRVIEGPSSIPHVSRD